MSIFACWNAQVRWDKFSLDFFAHLDHFFSHQAEQPIRVLSLTDATNVDGHQFNTLQKLSWLTLNKGQMLVCQDLLIFLYVYASVCITVECIGFQSILYLIMCANTCALERFIHVQCLLDFPPKVMADNEYSFYSFKPNLWYLIPSRSQALGNVSVSCCCRLFVLSL